MKIDTRVELESIRGELAVVECYVDDRLMAYRRVDLTKDYSDETINEVTEELVDEAIERYNKCIRFEFTYS